MALDQAETFEWLRNRVQELESQIESLHATHATEMEQVRRDAIEDAAKLVEDPRNINMVGGLTMLAAKMIASGIRALEATRDQPVSSKESDGD